MADGLRPLDRQGYTSTIYHLPDSPPRICKAFDKASAKTLYAVEKAAYERFATNCPPTSILKYYGTHESVPNGLLLEFAENKDVFSYLWRLRKLSNAPPPGAVLYRWARQVVEALEFAHSLGVYNSDIHCINFVLDHDLNLKVADWAGASIDGSRSHSSYRLRYRLYDADGTDVARAKGITVATEVFALGTALYYMVAGHEPWPELDEREQIAHRITTGDFPDTAELRVLGNVIQRCWRVEFASMTDVKLAVDAEEALRHYGSHASEASPASSF